MVSSSALPVSVIECLRVFVPSRPDQMLRMQSGLLDAQQLWKPLLPPRRVPPASRQLAFPAPPVCATDGVCVARSLQSARARLRVREPLVPFELLLSELLRDQDMGL